MSEITYDDKVDLQVATNIANINKVTASDMNEIKNVVNGNADEVGDITSLTTTDKTSVVDAVNELNAPEKWVSVGATAPTDGRRVWFAKGKNLFDGQLELGGYGSTGAKVNASNNYRNVNKIPVKPNTTYTFSINGVSQKYVLYFYNIDHNFVSQNSSLTTGTFTTPSNAYFVNFRTFVSDFVSDFANLKVQLEQGSTATAYEQYVNPSINVDGEEWYNPSLAIKTKVYPSVTTSDAGYYNLNIKCNEVAIIGFTHDPVASATRLQLYSNEQGWWFIRCSVGEVYAEKTITNLKIYYI